MENKIDPRKLEKNKDGVFKILEDGIVTVDKLLDVVDVKLDWYVPSDDAIEFILFIRLALGEEPENSNPKAHYFFADCLFQSENVKPYFVERNIDFDAIKGRTVIMASREFSKSVLTTYLILFMAKKGKMPGFGKVKYGIYVSDSMKNGVKTTMNTLEAVFLGSPYIMSFFESYRFTDSEFNLIRKPSTRREIEVYEATINAGGKKEEVPGRMSRSFAMKGVGAEAGARGSRSVLDRPSFALLDDLVASEKDASSTAILDSIESTIEADILKGLSGNGNFAILIGTPYNKIDPVYRRIEEGTWLPVVFPRAREIYDGITEEEFQSVWPDRHSYKRCMKDFMNAQIAERAGNLLPMRKLMQEYYLRISNDEDRMITDDMIQWYKREDVLKRLSSYNLYMTTDFTTSGSKGSDYSGIASWALGENGDWFMLDLTLRKLELEDQYNEVFRHVSTYGRLGYRGFETGVEVDGNQRTHILALKDRMIRKNIWFTLARQKGAKAGSEGILSRLEGGNKHWRFRNTLPLWQGRKIWFPKELKDTDDMRELVEELKYATYTSFASRHDDGADLISMLVSMETSMPMPLMHSEDEDAEDDEYDGKYAGKELGSMRSKKDMYYSYKKTGNGASAYDSYV